MLFQKGTVSLLSASRSIIMCCLEIHLKAAETFIPDIEGLASCAVFFRHQCHHHWPHTPSKGCLLLHEASSRINQISTSGHKWRHSADTACDKVSPWAVFSVLSHASLIDLVPNDRQLTVQQMLAVIQVELYSFSATRTQQL